MILAADVGGTKTLLGLFEHAGRKPRVVRQASYPSAEFDSFEALVDRFLPRRPARLHACAVGVAGPVVSGRSQVVNLRWPVSGRHLAAHLGLAPAHVHVINDLEATAWGAGALAPKSSVSLTPGVRPRPGNAALIAAGTGLGMALLVWDGERHRPVASEGGHQGFAPRGEMETDLLRFLARRHGRVSVERVVSGQGLPAIYEFLTRRRRGPSPRRRRRLAAGADPQAISDAALSGEDAVAGKALDLFVEAYGAAAGDLALVGKATAGVWVGGGIAPKILPRLAAGGFVRAFRDKGRLSPFVAAIPVRVILEPRTALFGAAVYAARRRA